MNLKNCYKILEIQETASLSEIKQAYRDMIGIWHPDRYVQNPRLHEKATEKLKELNLAYNELVTRLTSGLVKSNADPGNTGNDAHLIIVTCPGCQKKNRIKAGFVTRHPRCGACGILLFQKKRRHKHGKTHENKDGPRPSRATDSTDQTAGEKPSGSQDPFKEASVFQDLNIKRKRRFWNKRTILFLIICVGLVIANAENIRLKLTEGFKRVSGSRYVDYFKDPSLAHSSKTKSTTTSSDVQQIQQFLKGLGYGSDPQDGIWKEETLAAVKQFREDFFLEFRANDVTEITKALQRQRTIIHLHPDWPQIARSIRFNTWIKQQVMTSPKICREILSSGETQQVSSLLDWFKFDHLKPKQMPMPRNGILKKGYHKGLAPLTIQTRNDGRHYYLKLLNASNGSEILSAFLRGGSTFVEHVPVGKYKLKYAVGDTWYGTRWLFGPTTVFMKMDQVFDFKIQNNEIAGYRLDLFIKPVGFTGGKKEYAFDF